MSKETSPASDAAWLTVLATLLVAFAAIALWGFLVLLTDGPPSPVRVCIAAVFIGVYLSHYTHLKATKE